LRPHVTPGLRDRGPAAWLQQAVRRLRGQWGACERRPALCRGSVEGVLHGSTDVLWMHRWRACQEHPGAARAVMGGELGGTAPDSSTDAWRGVAALGAWAVARRGSGSCVWAAKQAAGRGGASQAAGRGQWPLAHARQAVTREGVVSGLPAIKALLASDKVRVACGELRYPCDLWAYVNGVGCTFSKSLCMSMLCSAHSISDALMRGGHAGPQQLAKAPPPCLAPRRLLVLVWSPAPALACG
jgi:hypothetical protein